MTHTRLMRKVRSLTAVVVGTAFLFSTAATPLVEASFWEQRRDASRRVNGKSEGTSPLLASLPAGMGEMEGVLPAVSGALGNALRSAPPAELSGVPASDTFRAADLPAWLRGLPNSAGEIRRIHLAKNPEKAPAIVLIQDAHDIPSAQRNIAQILSHIDAAAKDAKVLIGVEGAVGAFDIAPYRAQRVFAGHKIACDVLLNSHLIAAPEYFAFQSEKDPLLWGVETPADYIENVQAYRDSRPLVADVEKRMARSERALADRSSAVFSPELKTLDSALAAYAKGNLPFADYIRTLAERAPAKTHGVEVAKLLQALDMEGRMDFPKVERERADLIQALVQKLDPASLQGLLAASLAYRAGRVSYSAYYKELRSLAGRKGIQWADFPAFDKYVEYVLLAENIDKFALFDQVDDLRARALKLTAKTDDERALMALAEDLRLLNRLVKNEFGPAEWRSYQARRPDLAQLNARLAKVLGETAEAPPPETLAVFERFYQASDKRNRSLSDNLLAKARETKSRLLVLVAGGFHTPELEKAFEAEGASVVTVTPQVGEVPKGTQYLDFFVAKHIPLEQMLAGERLYLAPFHDLGQGIKMPGELARTAAEIAETATGVAWAATSDGLPRESLRQMAVETNLVDRATEEPLGDGVAAIRVEKGPDVRIFAGAVGPNAIENLKRGAGDFGASGLIVLSQTGEGAATNVVAVFEKAPAPLDRALSGAQSAGSFVVSASRSTWAAIRSAGRRAIAWAAGTLPSFQGAARSVSGILSGSSLSNPIQIGGHQQGVLNLPGIREGISSLRNAFLGLLAPHRVWRVAVPSEDAVHDIKLSASSWVAARRPGQFTVHNLGRVAQAAAQVINEKPARPAKILVGYGVRKGAKDYALHLARVLQANGLDVQLTKEPTPPTSGAEETRAEDGNRPFQYAFWVSAGSQPKLADLTSGAELLGIKIFRSGVPADERFMDSIASHANAPEARSGYLFSRRSVKGFDAKQRSIGRLQRAFGFLGENWWPRSFRGKVVIDSMHGVVADFSRLLVDQGIARVNLNSEPMGKKAPDLVLKDGAQVPWAPDPSDPAMISPSIKELQPGEWGFFFNSSGESLVVAEKGKSPRGEATVFSPNELSLIVAHYLMNSGQQGRIVRTMPTSRWLDRLASTVHGAGELRRVEVSPAGADDFPGQLHGALVAADASGHLIFQWNGIVFSNSAMAQALILLKIIGEGRTLRGYLNTIKSQIVAFELREESGLIPNTSQVAQQLPFRELVYKRDDLTVTYEQARNIAGLRENPQDYARALTNALADRKIDKVVSGISLKDRTGLLVEFSDGTWAMWKQIGPGARFRLYTEQRNDDQAAKAMEALAWVLRGAESLASRALSPYPIKSEFAFNLSRSEAGPVDAINGAINYVVSAFEMAARNVTKAGVETRATASVELEDSVGGRMGTVGLKVTGNRLFVTLRAASADVLGKIASVMPSALAAIPLEKDNDSIQAIGRLEALASSARPSWLDRPEFAPALVGAAADPKKYLEGKADTLNAEMGGVEEILAGRKAEDAFAQPVPIPEVATEADVTNYLRMVRDGLLLVIPSAGRATRLELPPEFDRLGLAGLTGRILDRLPKEGPVNASDFADDIERAAHGTFESLDDLSIVQREVLQWKYQLEAFLHQNPGTGLTLQNVLAGARVNLIVNGSNRETLALQLKAINFAGFNPQNVFIQYQAEEGIWRLSADQTHWEYYMGYWYPEGHGVPLLDWKVNGKVFNFNDHGEQTPLLVPLVQELKRQHIRYSEFGQVNDMSLMSDPAAPNRWAAVNLLMDQGVKFVLEFVDNPIQLQTGVRQKGGAAFSRINSLLVVMRDTLAMKTPALLSASIPPVVSRMLYFFDPRSLDEVSTEKVPFYANVRKTPNGVVGIGREAYSGDITSQIPSRIIQMHNVELNTFKVRARTEVAVGSMETQDDQPGFRDFVFRLVGRNALPAILSRSPADELARFGHSEGGFVVLPASLIEFAEGIISVAIPGLKRAAEKVWSAAQRAMADVRDALSRRFPGTQTLYDKAGFHPDWLIPAVRPQLQDLEIPASELIKDPESLRGETAKVVDSLGETPNRVVTPAMFLDHMVRGTILSHLARRQGDNFIALGETVLDASASFGDVLFSASVSRSLRAGFTDLAMEVRDNRDIQPVPIGGIDAKHPELLVLDHTASREMIQDVLSIANANLGQTGAKKVVVIESDLVRGANSDLIRQLTDIQGGVNVAVHVMGANDAISHRDENGRRVIHVKNAIDLLEGLKGVPLTHVDVVVPPASDIRLDTTGLAEKVVQLLRWILEGTAIPVTDGIEKGLRSLSETLKSA